MTGRSDLKWTAPIALACQKTYKVILYDYIYIGSSHGSAKIPRVVL